MGEKYLKKITPFYKMNDEFEDLKGFEGYYKINKNGQIYGNKSKKILNTYDSSGYNAVDLYVDGVRKKKKIHRLLALQYLENLENFSQVDHVDRNTKNNNLSNLRWCDSKLNCRNRCSVYNQKGCICKCEKKKGTYYSAKYYIDFKVRKTKGSYDRDVCQKWLEEMYEKYPRNKQV